MVALEEPRGGPAGPAGLDPTAAQLLDRFLDAADNTAAFLRPNEALASEARSVAKALFDHTLRLARTRNGADPDAEAPRLHVDGFHAEQIWAQMDMEVGPLVKRVRRLLKRCGGDGADVSLLTSEARDLLRALEEGGVPGGALEGGDGDWMDDDYDDYEENDTGTGTGTGTVTGTEAGGSGQGWEEEDGGRALVGEGSLEGRDGRELLPTEDEFFRLDEMEAFVREAEEQAMEGGESSDGGEGEGEGDDGGGGDVGDEEDAEMEALLDREYRRAKAESAAAKSRDYGADPGSDAESGSGDDDADGEGILGDMGGDDDEGDGGGMKEATYEDFFGPRRRGGAGAGRRGGGVGGGGREGGVGAGAGGGAWGGDEGSDGDMELDDMDMDEDGSLGEEDERDHLGTGTARRMRKRGLLDDDHDNDGDNDDDDKDKDDKSRLSRHERRMLAIRERIADLEERAAGERPWYLMGEADASRRPLNSALALDLDFERGVRPPPEPTAETADAIEGVIRRRIVDKRWDDVVRVVRVEEKKRARLVELSDDKHKEGLGEIYEKEYVAAKTGAGVADKDDPIRQEALSLFQQLSGKLDALTRFHFAPKPVVDEMRVQASVPSLAMEEVLPVSVAPGDTLAPEEVFKSKQGADVKAEGEMSREERKRRRAKKKRVGSRIKHEREERRRVADEARAAGIRSESREEADKGLNPRGVKTQRRAGERSEFGKSASVFARMQEVAEMERAGVKVWQAKKEAAKVPGQAAKLRL